MIVVDVETTGVDPQKHSIVSIGALEFERPENQFYGECRIWDGAKIQDEALAVNGFGEKDITDPTKQSLEMLMIAFLEWSDNVGERTPAGQNVGSFDLPFLRTSALRYSLNWNLPHRSIDVHTLTYMHIVKAEGEGTPPTEKRRTAINSSYIQQYVGIPEEPTPHNALTGAKVFAEVISRLLYSEPLLDEFKGRIIPWDMA